MPCRRSPRILPAIAAGSIALLVAAASLRVAAASPSNSIVGATLLEPSIDARRYVGSITFDALVGCSDVIVLAKVERIDKSKPSSLSVPFDELRIAEASVLETWKGRPGATVCYRASPTFICDGSDAVVGETAVLFLCPPDEHGMREIMNVGSGRMQVESEGAARYATIHSQFIELPPPGPPNVEAPETLLARLDLDALRQRTREHLKRHETLETLVAAADLIVLAMVEEVVDERWVVVRVDERWKGTTGGAEKLTVRGTYSWPLDEIGFARSQRQVLFLGAPLSDGSRPIVGADRGRMTIVKVAGVPLGVAWVVDVDWPRDLRVDEEPDRPGLLYGRIDLERLERRIETLDD